MEGMERVLAKPVIPPTIHRVPTTNAGYADCGGGMSGRKGLSHSSSPFIYSSGVSNEIVSVRLAYRRGKYAISRSEPLKIPSLAVASAGSIT